MRLMVRVWGVIYPEYAARKMERQCGIVLEDHEIDGHGIEPRQTQPVLHGTEHLRSQECRCDPEPPQQTGRCL